MSQPNSGFGETNAARAAATPPPNPKIQAVDFALQLAGINATAKPQDVVSAQKIVDDAKVIAGFLGGTVS